MTTLEEVFIIQDAPLGGAQATDAPLQAQPNPPAKPDAQARPDLQARSDAQVQPSP